MEAKSERGMSISFHENQYSYVGIVCAKPAFTLEKVLNTDSSGRKIQGGRLENASNSTKPQPAERSIALDGWCVDATLVNYIPTD